MCEFPSFPLFVSDYLGKTHPHLTLEQHGTYLLLLMFSWQRPTCALPDDDLWLAKRLDIQLRTWRPLRKTVLEQFFKQDEKGEWFSQRLRKEREYVSKIRRKSSENSLKRWSVSKENNDLAENRHMHPTPPHPKEEERESASQTLRARDEGSGDLFRAEKQAPASPAERGSARTEFADRPTSPITASPSLSSASKEERQEGRKASKEESVPPDPPRAPPPIATVAPSPDAAAGCGVPKRRSKTKPAVDTAESDEFWRAYPRHDDKYRFRFAFAEALKKTTTAELIAAAKRYATSRTGEDPKWTKLAVNWLREERWLDEPAPRVIDQAGNPATPRQVYEPPMSSSDRKRQVLREAGMLS
jgi:uncharacterized protein YdaU (DUF1376 family)